MLRVETTVGPSSVHGNGLFAARDIYAGEWVWEFDRTLDSRKPVSEATPEELHFGYVSNASGMLVSCADDAKWFNFGLGCHNCAEIPVNVDGEPLVIAVRDIEEGEELLIDVKSDRDARRKLLLE